MKIKITVQNMGRGCKITEHIQKEARVDKFEFGKYLQLCLLKPCHIYSLTFFKVNFGKKFCLTRNCDFVIQEYFEKFHSEEGRLTG